MTNIIRFLRRIGAMCIICGLINGIPALPLSRSTSFAGMTARSTTPAHWVPWSFQESFGHGIPGWISYPLVQDEGYDPSLYTANQGGLPVLVRDVTAYGQKVLRVGLLRPLQFYAFPSAIFNFSYNLTACGPVTGAQMMLAAADGKKYIASIPSGAGKHAVQLRGRQFGLPASGVSIQAVVIEAKIAHPLLGSHNRLTLLAFGLKAERSSVGLALQTPRRAISQSVPPHPRILLASERLAQLKSMPGSKALMKFVDHRAAQLRASIAYNPRAGENIALLSPASVFPGLPQYGQLLDSYANAIAFNALDYRLSGSTQALEAARKALLTVAQWATWTPPWFPAHGLFTYYQVGGFTQRVALGYDLIADRLSAEQKSRIAEAFWKDSILPTLQDYFFNNRLPTASSNHMANSVGGAIAACVALDGDVPGWTSHFGPALAELMTSYESLLQGLFPGDGSEAEPAGYEDFAMQGMSFGAAALQSLGIRPRGMERMLQSFWWLRYAEFAPGKFLDTGDFGMDLQSLSGYAWAAENAGDPALEQFYEGAKSGTLQEFIRRSQAGNRLAEGPTMLDLVCCTRPARHPLVHSSDEEGSAKRGVVPAGATRVRPAPPLARLFPLRGSAVMRSGWTPGSTVISLRVGPWFNHEHHDQGSFQVAAWGEDLVAEAGYADYYKDPRYADYFSQAPGHNTVLVDADPFSQEDYDGRYWPALHRYPKFQGHVFSEALDFISANLAPAYNDDEKLDDYVREYVFIKPDVLIVHDRLRAPLPHHYAFLLHVPPGDPIRLHGSEAVIHGKAAFSTVTSRGIDWTLHPAPVPENAYANLDRDNVLPRKTLRLDTPPATSADFGVAMRFQPASQNPATFTAFKTISGFGFNSPDGKTAVLFRTSPGMLVSHNTPPGDVSSDGDVVAVTSHNGVKDVLAVEAGELRLAGTLLFGVEPATSKVDIILHHDASGELVHLDCVRETNLQVYASRNPVVVTLDGTSIPLLVSNGFVSIPRLTQGEHVVGIRY